MDWRWRGLSARPSLQRTSKASTKGAVKEAAMVKLPLLCPELVLQAMKVIFSGRQGKSADGWISSLAQKSVGRYNWLTQIPRLSQHGTGRRTAHGRKNTFPLQNAPNSLHWRCPPPSVGAVVFTSFMQMTHPTDGCGALLPAAVNTVDISSVDFTRWEEKSRYHQLCLGLLADPPKNPFRTIKNLSKCLQFVAL